MTHTGLNLNSLHHGMQLGLLLNGDEDSLDSDELMQTQIWALQDELCQKASKVARLNGQPMEQFNVSSADLKELANNKQRLRRLQMKLSMLDNNHVVEIERPVRRKPLPSSATRAAMYPSRA